FRSDQSRATSAGADEARAHSGERGSVAPLAALERQAALRPLAPRAGIEAALAAGQPCAVEGDAGRHARAAVGDELAGRQLRERLVPRSIGRARDPAGRIVDFVRLAAPAVRRARVEEQERPVGEPARDLLRRDRVALALARYELGRLDLLLTRPELASPGVDPTEQDGTVVVAEVPEQPPEPLGTAHQAVRDDE